jgi:hypothetical protein
MRWAANLLARDDAGRIAANIAPSAGSIASLNNRPTEFCAGGPFVADGGSNYCCFVVLPFM